MKLAEVLYQYTNDQLKTLARLCDCGRPTRKAEIVDCITQAMLNPVSLRQLWEQLDNLAKRAVAAAYYNEGEFNTTAFVAQYGSLPPRPKKVIAGWHYDQPSLLDLFLHNVHSLQNYYQQIPRLPDDLMLLLAELVPPPDKFQITGLQQAPSSFKNAVDEIITPTRAETELVGLHDLVAYLRLVDRGELSSGTDKLTLGGIKKLLANLLQGDFLPLPEKYRANDTIRPFGLDMFARQAGLVIYRPAGLQLTGLGRAYYQSRDPALLLEAVEAWSESNEFDELSRISSIKGQKSRSTSLTPPTGRREAIVEALSWCPPGVWIKLEDFYRAIKIWHFDFEVENSFYPNLYIGHPEYGLLHNDAYWTLVKGLYINAVLWETLGTIGALDLLYIDPEEATLDVNIPYYDDNMFSYSLYDGLKYFRINNLGAYLLGHTGEYVASRPLDPPLFSISENLIVTLAAPAEVTPNDRHMLEQVAVPAGSGAYRLEMQQLLLSLETGSGWQELVDFLERRHNGPLPPAVSAWLERARQNSRAFRPGGPALFIKIGSADLADLVTDDPVLQKFCRFVDPKTIVIPANKEKALRTRLKEMEYVLLD